MQGVALLLRRKAVHQVIEFGLVRDEHLHRQRQTYKQAVSPHIQQLYLLGYMGFLDRVSLACLSPTR